MDYIALQDYLSSCVNMAFDNKKIDSFCFYCQGIILNDISSELHTVTANMFFLVLDKTIMEFHVCCCLFDYYLYKVSARSYFTYSQDVYKKKTWDTFPLCAQLILLFMLFMGVFIMQFWLGGPLRLFDQAIVNQTLNRTCHVWISFFAYHEKKHGTVTNSFQNLKCFLLKEDDSIDRNHAMSYFCFECFQNCVGNFLYDEFILLKFKKKFMLQNVKAKDLFIFRSGFCFLVCFYDTYCLVFIIDRGEKII